MKDNIINPNSLLEIQYPKVFETYKWPFSIVEGKVIGYNEDFFAATLGEGQLSERNNPAVFLPAENKFYQYNPKEGIYLPITEDALQVQLTEIMRYAADEPENNVFHRRIHFEYTKNSVSKGIVKKAKGILEKSSDYFDSQNENFIPCKNGILNIDTMVLKPFDSSCKLRRKLDVDFTEDAKCPGFLNYFLGKAIDPEDVEILQLVFGLILLGKNLAQKMIIITGESGTGKSQLMGVLLGVIGEHNMANLRTDQLCSRFEFGAFLNKSFLLCSDAPTDFLQHPSAQMLKTLTGGDPNEAEIKYKTERVQFKGNFNVVITGNDPIELPRKGDLGPWKRRLVFIQFPNEKIKEPISDYYEVLLKEEGSGILNWAIDGLIKLREAKFRFPETEKQKNRFAKRAREVNSVIDFVKDCVYRKPKYPITANDLYEAYEYWCIIREMEPVIRHGFNSKSRKAIKEVFKIGARNDVPGSNGLHQFGWMGLYVKSQAQDNSSEATKPSPNSDGKNIIDMTTYQDS